MSAEASSKPNPQKGKKFRLWITLIVPFVVQIVGTVGLVGYLSFRNGQKAVNDLASQLRSELTLRIERELKSYLTVPHDINQFNATAFARGELDFANPENVSQLLQQAKIYSFSYGIYCSTQKGEHLAVRLEEFKNGKNYVRLDTGKLRIANESTNHHIYTYKLDADGNRLILNSKDEKIYDPRNRPWYKAAVAQKRPTWSDVYLDFTSLIPTITASQPVYDSRNGQLLGVCGVDVLLPEQFRKFLSSLKIGKHGGAFVMNRSGQIMSSSTDEKLTRGEGQNAKLIQATESSEPLIRETAIFLQKKFDTFKSIQESQQLDFLLKSQRQLVQVLPLKDDKGLDWLIVVTVPESDFMEQINANTINTIILALIALLIAIAIGILTGRWMTRPILEVSQAACEIADGKLDQNIAPSNIIEIEKLSNSFNSMAKQLQKSFATLEEQNEDLKRLDQLKDEFLANTSHELRTPLNGIIGIAESLMDGATGELSPTTQRNLTLIISSGHRLSRLVNDILDFSKLKHKNIELQLKPLDLRSIIDEVLTLSLPLVANKNLQLINRIPGNLPTVEADEDRLQQILHNLVGNAIKFTPSGTVEVTAEVIFTHSSSVIHQENLSNNQQQTTNHQQPTTNNQQPTTNNQQQIAITISDTGIGIPADKFDRIFESFEQAEGSTAREYGGTGLGLAVTKTLVELHGGEITVHSTVGKGSQFTFTLPSFSNQTELNISPSSVESQEPIKPISDIRNNNFPTPISSHIHPSTTAISRQIPQSATPIKSQISHSQTIDGTQYKVLIVDDEPVNRQVLINHLALYNYEITEASNGLEALTVIDNGFIPDIILLDVMMPSMTGYQVCQTIRNRFPAQELPIVMLTAKNQVADIVEGFASGANDYLCKPIQKQEMLARLKTHLHLAKLTSAYGRFVPQNFLRFLQKESIIDVQLGDQVQQKMTAMFSDIRSFTTLSEGMSPQETFDFINSYLSRVSPLIRQHNGFIDKYIGDGIMALFPDSANDGVESAIAMEHAMVRYNQARQQQGDVPIAIGIGLHTGNLMLGTIGESERMETTVISDAVNLASRLEGLTKLYGVGILVSEATISQLSDVQNYTYRFLDRVRVKGKKQPIAIYELYDEKLKKSNQLKTKTRKIFQQAVFAYSQGNFAIAEGIFQKILKLNPQDRAAILYIKRCQRYQKYGVPEGWEGVTNLGFK
ncbi:ATP-binding protein [Limnofasciculus baicalensis]|uniref:histidine kinase n=1 Tax=Limnofasciculus baicalensis BBK-W-15 TaxID=2699891 RepID=A0AAE3GN70_9CYAN|nr:ATP-binding protein [Limnofasciculus baicalensis]MCP2727700.1 ATP-binding protein [Limnofasciculus baicalensis BBK-W-15]